MPYWYWFTAAAALFILEMFSGTFYLLVLSIALLGAGLTAWLFGADASASLLVAAVLSAVGIAAVYRWQRSRRTPPGKDVDLDIGNTVILHQAQPDNLWLVQYRGSYWQAQADFTAQAGQSARITGKSGNILILKPLEEN